MPYSHARQSDVEAPAPEPEAQQEPAVSQSNDVAKQEAADAPDVDEDSWLARLGKRRAEAIVASGEVPSGEDLAILRFAMPEALPPELRNGDLRIGLGV